MMMSANNAQEIKQQVQSFYNRIGWQEVSEGVYQNARFEDLRPVSSEYIHRCHIRAGTFLAKTGHYLLDAGSGPIQYPEYLLYSEDYDYRVCVDISPVALFEARRRIGTNGLYVVADVSALPFTGNIFDGVISLHTLHHLPESNQQDGYLELWRVLAPGKQAVVVNGWTDAPLMRRYDWLVRIATCLMNRMRHRKVDPNTTHSGEKSMGNPKEPVSTYVQKFTPERLKQMIGEHIPYEIRCWRSVSVRFLRAVIHPKLAGRLILRLLYRLEEVFPYYFGVVGQYPLIILKKSG